MILAIIPARGGSKRIPRKNIKEFCGKPMINWVIDTAHESAIFDSVLVSTDDEQIATVASAAGAEAPFRRPAALSGDYTPTLPVIAHAIQWFEENRGIVTLVCCLYPTAAFLRPHFIKEGLNLLKTHPDADFTIGAISSPFNIFRSLKKNDDGSMSMFWPEKDLTRSQDLPDAFYDSGQFYWGRKDAFKDRTGVLSARCYSVMIPRYLAQDIDTHEDWEVAERIFAFSRSKYG